MHLFEMFDHSVDGYQNTSDDNSQPKWHESRKTKLTLKQIRQLRRMNDVRNFEQHQYLEKVRSQYGAPAGQPPTM